MREMHGQIGIRKSASRAARRLPTAMAKTGFPQCRSQNALRERSKTRGFQALVRPASVMLFHAEFGIGHGGNNDQTPPLYGTGIPGLNDVVNPVAVLGYPQHSADGPYGYAPGVVKPYVTACSQVQ